MMHETIRMEYGMMDSRSAAKMQGADGCVSVFQKSYSFIFRTYIFLKD